MIKKIKASTSEKVIFVFILVLGLFTLTSFLLMVDGPLPVLSQLTSENAAS